MILLLLENPNEDLDKNIQENINDKNLLHESMDSANVKIIKYLLDNGLNPNTVSQIVDLLMPRSNPSKF